MTAKPTPEEALCFMADAMLYQRIDLTGPWQGWKLRGRVLVSPDGDRVPVERLRGMLFTESLKRPKRNKGFSRDTCKNAPYNLFSLVDSFGCRIFLGASSVSAIGSQLRQQLLQRGHTHVGPQRLGLCLFATLPLLR